MELLPGFDAYKSHKVVGALHIAFLMQRQDNVDGFVAADGAGNEWYMTPEFSERHNPEQGGYIVQYEDGYMSYSPRLAFENGYTLNDPLRDGVASLVNLSYGSVIVGLKLGNKYARKGWNGKDMYIRLQVPDVHSKMSLPYIYMRTAQGDLVPWLCSQTDGLATDWELV